MSKENTTAPSAGHSFQIIFGMLLAVTGALAAYFIITYSFLDTPFKGTQVMISYNDGMMCYANVQSKMPPPAQIPIPAGGEKPFMDPHKIVCHQNPALMMWTMFIVILMALELGMFPFFIWQVMQLHRSSQLDAKHLYYTFVFSVIFLSLAVLPALVPKDFLMPDQIIDGLKILFKSGWLLKAVVVAVAALVIPEVMLVLTIGFACDKLALRLKHNNQVTQNYFRELAKAFDMLNKDLAKALQLLAAVVALLVLAIISLGDAINSTVLITDFRIYPDTIYIVYGLWLSLFLGIFYAPTYGILVYLNRQLRGQFDKYITGSAKPGEEWTKEISDLIDMKDPAREYARLLITILLPLFASLLPQLKNIKLG